MYDTMYDTADKKGQLLIIPRSDPTIKTYGRIITDRRSDRVILYNCPGKDELSVKT